MTNMNVTGADAPLTPRQDRLEAQMIAVLRRGGTRSSLRVAVDDFADFARLQGIPAESALDTVRSAAQRAGPEMAARGESVVGESIGDRVAMMVRWFGFRYHRVD
ncbi:MAG: hypothetical protein ABIT20_20120 [Gemmatimonadaceae bacterium]